MIWRTSSPHLQLYKQSTQSEITYGTLYDHFFSSEIIVSYINRKCKSSGEKYFLLYSLPFTHLNLICKTSSVQGEELMGGLKDELKY